MMAKSILFILEKLKTIKLSLGSSRKHEDNDAPRGEPPQLMLKYFIQNVCPLNKKQPIFARCCVCGVWSFHRD